MAAAVSAVSVPAAFVKDAPIYWEFENMQCLGLPLSWCGCPVPPPTLAAFVCLEMLDNDFVIGRPGATAESVAVCLYVLSETTAAAEAIHAAEAYDGAPPKTLLDATATAWLGEKLERPPGPADIETLRRWIAAALSGYQMIPDSGNHAGGLYLFGAPTIGSTIAGLAGTLGSDAYALVWEVPLCLAGHVLAGRAMGNGVKGVGRPKDRDDIRQQIADAKAREERGELHPWQRTAPRDYPLSLRQAENLETAAQYQEALRCQP